MAEVPRKWQSPAVRLARQMRTVHSGVRRCPRGAISFGTLPSQIVVRGLRKQFPKVLAVAGVDLDVAAGEVFGLLGPNGAGKTTTLEMIEGLTPAGRRRDRDLRPRTGGENAQEIRARIGVQLQATSLYNKITPREALDLFGSYYPKRRGTDELLELVQLKDKADAYHVTLSGGQAQRLALALALVNDPEVVFLDEPTAGLDPQGRRSLWEVVRTMKAEGRTTMLTTHYMDEAEALCDRLAILDHGKILRSGTPAELIASLGIPSVVELDVRRRRARPGGVRGAARRGRRGARRRLGDPDAGPEDAAAAAPHDDRERAPRLQPGARAPGDARGRLPAADRPEPARLSERDAR